MAITNNRSRRQIVVADVDTWQTVDIETQDVAWIDIFYGADDAKLVYTTDYLVQIVAPNIQVKLTATGWAKAQTTVGVDPTVTVERNTPITSGITTDDTQYRRVIRDSIDKLTMIAQEMATDIRGLKREQEATPDPGTDGYGIAARSVRVPPLERLTRLPAAVSRINKLLGFGASGDIELLTPSVTPLYMNSLPTVATPAALPDVAANVGKMYIVTTVYLATGLTISGSQSEVFFSNGVNWVPLGNRVGGTGNADIDLTVNPNGWLQIPRTMILPAATSLSANRAITLTTVNAWDGMVWEVIRKGGGAFNLTVGGKAIATGNTARFVYRSGVGFDLAHYGANT